MGKIGEIFIDGKPINLDSTEVGELEKILKSTQSKKCEIKDKLNEILEEIYN